MSDYIVPQVLVFQEFTLAPAGLTAPLRACIVGEQFALNRYSDSDEKSEILVTNSYNPDSDESFAWPNRQAGAVVDQTYTKVYIDDALLQYYFDPGGDGSVVQAVSGYRNRIRFDSLVLKTANGFSRSAAFEDRDVAVGDVLDIATSACGEPFLMRTIILGLVADEIAAVVDSASADTSNQGDLSELGTNTQTDGDVNQVTITSVDASNYDGREDGNVKETYIVDVVSGSVGGDAETALLQVTRQSDGAIFNVTPSDFGVATEIGSRGLEVTFDNSGSSSVGSGVDPDDFIVGQQWTVSVQQDWDAPVASSGGDYNGAADTTYIIEVTKGGDFGDAEISVTTTTGVDSSPATVVSGLGTAVVIGSQGVTVTFVSGANGLRTGDRYLIPVEAATDGPVKTVITSNVLPPELRGICEVDLGGGSSSSSSGTAPDLAVTFYIKSDIEVPEGRVGQAPLVNWVQSETQITLKEGVTAFDASWTVGGVLTALPVKDGIVYVEHRDRVNEHCSAVGSISDVSDIGEMFDVAPVVDPDNPLVYGVFKALENSSGTAVKFLGVCSSSPVTLNDWLDALDILKDRQDVYSLVPLTYDKSVQDAFVGHVNTMSAAEIGRWRIAWLNRQAETEQGIYTQSEATGSQTGDPVLATITDDPATTGTQYTLVTASGEQFLTGTSGVRAGDILRTGYQDDGFGNVTYDEYVIDAVLNDEELRLSSGPNQAVNVPSKIEIWRDLTRQEIANELASYPGEAGATRRAYLVWPDEIGNAGMTVPGYFLCCSLAGLRSAAYPHRPLTNVEIAGWDNVSRTTEFFTLDQLNTLADAGWWIVTQDPDDGDVFTRHQLSTNTTDINRSEQSVTTNVDSISYTFLRRLAPYIGRSNVTPTAISVIEGEIISVLENFSNFTPNDLLGPQLLGYEIAQLEQHPVLRDRILAVVQLDVPYPLNNIELHLVI
jgi:hypothetical protein